MGAVFAHAVAKADAMGVTLSVDCSLSEVAWKHFGAERVATVMESLVLRASNGVVEASDHLSEKHDWLQTVDEITRPMRRLLYLPSCAAADWGIIPTRAAIPGSLGPP